RRRRPRDPALLLARARRDDVVRRRRRSRGRRKGTSAAVRAGTALTLALLTVTTAPLLLSLCRRLTAMAAAGDPYSAGSVSAAFVTCPNEDVATRMAR
ncbi:protein CutA-like, partial [Phasianus colchicus]|uniref:protein CutA-like n=1 Tax=Phasianus colchicus TaxID=9054 RepID=UPI00129EAB1B